MAWLPSNSGRTATEFPLTFSGGGSIPSYLLHPHNQYAEIIKTLAPAIKEYIREQKADAIANQLMNMEQPPRAEAVDPSIQGPMATAPATGGADAYKAQKLYQDYISKQQADQSQSTNDYWKNKVLEAQANKYNADADDPGTGINRQSPVVDEQTGMIWNGRQWVRPTKQEADWSTYMPIARGQLDAKGEFTNTYPAPAGAKDNAAGQGAYVQLRTPEGKTLVVPWDEYQKRAGRANGGAEMYRSRVQSGPVAAAVPSDQAETIARAKQAIAKGANPEDVKKRLEEAGYDSTGL